MADFKVSAERIKLFDHPKADRLQVAKVGMFSLVVAKGIYQDGDVVVFAPKRAILPEEIRDHYRNQETGVSYLKNDSIVRSIRLRGELSEGVLLDKKWVVHRVQHRFAVPIVENLHEIVGQDISSDLGITEYVPELPSYYAGVVNHIRASRYSQHDVEGVRIFQDEFKPGECVIVSEKLHGSQINIIFHEDGLVEVGSKGLLKRGFVLEEDNSNIYWQAFNNSGLRNIINSLFPESFVQVMGEVIPVQKGFSYGYNNPTLRVFRLEVNGVRQSPVHISNAAKIPGLTTICELADMWVPFVEMAYSLPTIETMVQGKEGVSGKNLHITEGVVVEPLIPRLDKTGKFPLYLKVINPAFKDDDDALS